MNRKRPSRHFGASTAPVPARVGNRQPQRSIVLVICY
jgi:hypothetical protein